MLVAAHNNDSVRCHSLVMAPQSLRAEVADNIDNERIFILLLSAMSDRRLGRIVGGLDHEHRRLVVRRRSVDPILWISPEH